jgi:hypothetical protein
MRRRNVNLSDKEDMFKDGEICPHCGGLRERCWIDYPEDNNCANISVKKHGAMTLSEVSKRIGVSLVRISQIEKQALTKLKKRLI